MLAQSQLNFQESCEPYGALCGLVGLTIFMVSLHMKTQSVRVSEVGIYGYTLTIIKGEFIGSHRGGKKWD